MAPWTVVFRHPFLFHGMYESFACCGENCICYCAIGLFFSFS
ncbi:beta galactofuranosyl glycosyltransferase, putative, partial [Trypanosoma cruzi]